MRLNKILSLQFGFFLIIGLLLASVQSVVFSHDFYTELYARIRLAQRENISEEDLENSLFMMVDYVQSERDDLDGTITWHGQKQETFNTREKRHMKDVRTLWQRARLVMILSWILAVLAAVIILVREGLDGVGLLARGLMEGLACFAVVLVFFGFWWLIDFTGFWTWFHTIVFPGNTDWLLDPATDFMIVICPEEMFSTMVFQIAARLIASLAMFGAIAWLCQKTLPAYRMAEQILMGSRPQPECKAGNPRQPE